VEDFPDLWLTVFFDIFCVGKNRKKYEQMPWTAIDSR
jgi:hypothetical protein